jgi:PAS domain S-box-containing protein
LDNEKPILRVLQRVPAPVVIANPVTGKILWVNKRLADLQGSSDPHQVIGTSLFDFIQASQLGTALADLARVVAGQSPPPVTYQLQKQSGEFAAVQVSSVPMMYQGQPAMLSFVVDVSERERMVRDLTESEERYRLLLESMPSGLVVVVNDEVAYVNKALLEALGYQSRELLGKPMYGFIRADYRQPVRDARRQMLRTGQSYPASSVVLIRKDGTELATTAASSVIHWGGERATQTFMHDMG